MKRESAIKKQSLNIDELVKALFKETDWMVKVGVGGVLAAAGLVAILYNYICLPIFVAFWALMIGYCLRCMRLKFADAESKLPGWDEWGDLFMSGITWIALQTAVFLVSNTIFAIILGICTGNAFNTKSELHSFLWILLSSVLVLPASAFIAVISSYTMVNFAVEENLLAGLAYIKVLKSLLKNPAHLLSGFLLALGIQLGFVLIPCLTIIGVFLVPSSYFAGQVLSSLILARHWAICQDSSQT